MNRKQAIDTVVSILAVVLGIIIFYFAVNSYKDIDQFCGNNTLRNSLTVVLGMSAGVATAGLSYFGCMISSKNCYSDSSLSNNTSAIYFGIASVIALTMIVSISIVISELNKDKSNKCGGSALKRDMGISLGLAIIIFIASVIGVSVSSTVIWKYLGGASSSEGNSSESPEAGILSIED